MSLLSDVVGSPHYATTGLMLLVGRSLCPQQPVQAQTTTEVFAREVERVLPQEELYDYHKRLSQGPVHVARRDAEARPRTGELAVPEQGWKLVWNQRSSPVLQNAVRDFQDYLDKSMRVQVEAEGRDSLEGWQSLSRSIVVGTRDQLPGCGSRR